MDTDHVSLVSWASGIEGGRIRDRLHTAGEVAVTTIVTYEEQTRGWLALLAKARSPSQMVVGYNRLQRHLNAFRTIDVVGFDDAAALTFFELRGLRLRVASMDLRIASIVLSREATLLSRNLIDFRKVPGLKVEVWSA